MPRPSGSRAVTMADVAREAGVSRPAVSFVLNGSTAANIGPDARRRIVDAAARLGYRPNAAARALAQQRSDWIGLVTEIVTAPFAVDIIKGAQDRALHDGRYLLIASTESSPELERSSIERLLEQRVEGLILAATWHRGVDVPDLVHEVPTVLVNCFDNAGRLPSVVPDEIAGGRRAATRLVSAGHRRIGLINLDGDIPAAVGRRAGLIQVLDEAGLTLDPAREAVGHATADGGYVAAAQLLDAADPPTAIFCANDRMAMGAYDAIKERGLRIPHDVAVVGFDNQEVIAAYLRPALTTVALPFEEMGSRGVDLLASITAGSSTTTTQVMVDCPLLERSSV